MGNYMLRVVISCSNEKNFGQLIQVRELLQGCAIMAQVVSANDCRRGAGGSSASRSHSEIRQRRAREFVLSASELA
ncbi:Uncharacterised protein [Mycolicibacterium phlei]|uniref:hypothetical protein n=1 Tax=Mycobacteroides chelonae TaxID=1774 RepID=UPI000618ACDD|nr:hypothetical protein [Mycobacteroides chelonae]VEG15787.1 Uncharacterised protein [Mycolicibacterium phlei]AKC38475.1 hypothetical protein GR01_07735 [Mycobacteroides chelonae]ANB00870.1 hypothetical protein BB28_08215 [Mycobacteroides chelonae CCUG 47445]OLT75163.1 hypothetical protein BKG56_15420 [Mycobacteroides chelonae]ORV12812.1 hypothetical protein AWB96_15660 [Mycobacteroides chelonae]